MPYLQPLLFLAAITLAILGLSLYAAPRWHVIREGNHYGVYHPKRRHMWIAPYRHRKNAQAECNRLNQLTEQDFNWEGKILAHDGVTWVIPGDNI
jgi:hypothetical protein